VILGRIFLLDCVARSWETTHGEAKSLVPFHLSTIGEEP
jgi:hypothetical protein